MKLPWSKFYPGDWLSDEQLALCSAETHGVWIKMTANMMKSGVGEVKGTLEQLARMVGFTPEVVQRSLDELSVTGSADVLLKNGIVTVVCRRLKRDEKSRQQTRLRVERHRRNGAGNDNLPDLQQESNGVDIRSQISEVRERAGTDARAQEGSPADSGGAGAGIAPPPPGSPEGVREAVLPTVAEVVAAGERCVPGPAPRAYCEWWFRKFPSSMGGWLRRGFLVDWPWELGQWWRRDQRAFGAGTHAACFEGSAVGDSLKNGAGARGVTPAGPPVPRWKRIKELEGQEGPIWTHPANRESKFYDKKRATLEARKELGKLVGELDQLKAEERSGAAST